MGQVGSEDQHGTDADGQGEESLAHGGVNYVAPAQPVHGFPVGDQIELDAFFRSVQEQGMGSQDNHEQQQGGHHPFGDPFHPVLDTQVTYGKAQQTGDHHPEQQGGRVLQHGAERSSDELGGSPYECALDVEPAVVDHPAGDRGVIHHQHVAAHDADALEPVPAGARRFQNFEASGSAAAAAPADGKFADHHRDAHDQQEHQINQDEGGSAELAAQVREFPHVPDADGAAGTDQDEAQPGAEGFRGSSFLSQKNTSFQNVTNL